MAARLITIASVIVGIFLYWVSAGHANADAYLFPRILAATMIVLGVAMTVAEWTPAPLSPKDTSPIPWLTLWPALVIFVLYMLAAPRLGFYLSSALAFVALGVVYSPADSVVRAATRCVPISLAFLAVLYVVFVLLLQVQMPRGLAL